MTMLVSPPAQLGLAQIAALTLELLYAVFEAAKLPADPPRVMPEIVGLSVASVLPKQTTMQLPAVVADERVIVRLVPLVPVADLLWTREIATAIS
jgi:hypothetical protein